MMCPYCKRQIREMTDEEKEIVRKEEMDSVKSALIGGVVSFLFVAILLGSMFFILFS